MRFQESSNSQATVREVRRQRPKEDLDLPCLKFPRPIRLDQGIKILRPRLLEVAFIDVAELVPRRAGRVSNRVSILMFLRLYFKLTSW